MWFDPHAMRAENVGHPHATSATTATQTPAVRPVSQVSRLSQALQVQKPAFRVASVAPPLPEAASSALNGREAEARFPHAYSALGGPVTWTGRVVSLDEWRSLTDWERHGPKDMLWCGKRKQWVPHDR